ncbi:hypothetical protein EC991_001673, partial [Linnemannia zychae]
MKISIVLTVLAAVVLVQAAPVPSIDNGDSISSRISKRSPHHLAFANNAAASSESVGASSLVKRHHTKGDKGGKDANAQSSGDNNSDSDPEGGNDNSDSDPEGGNDNTDSDPDNSVSGGDQADLKKRHKGDKGGKDANAQSS